MTTPGSDYRHLENLIELLRADLREAVSEIKTALASRVDVGVYAADQRRIDQRFEQIDEEIADVKRKRDAEKTERRADRRIVIGSVASGALSLLVALIVLALQLLTG